VTRRWQPRAKPIELLNLHAPAQRLFQLIREEFGVPEVYELKLRSVDAGQRDTSCLAALAMEGSQTLRRIATQGQEITSEDAVAICFQLAETLELLAREATEPTSDVLLKIKEDLAEASHIMMDFDAPTGGRPTRFI
jgi:hypothetical protein